MKLHYRLDETGCIVSAPQGKFPSDDECAQIVSDLNFSMSENLIRSLVAARELSGREPNEVAHILGVSTEVLEEIESGNFDLSIDDLREYLYAIDAIGSFRVTPNARKAIFTRLVKSASESGSRMWRESKRLGTSNWDVSPDSIQLPKPGMAPNA